jgi:hypothetical protein
VANENTDGMGWDRLSRVVDCASFDHKATVPARPVAIQA